MRVRVDSQDELSQSTQDALRFTRRLGGYIVWARYGAPGKRGDSELALRVPIGKVQTAIAHFAGYGSLAVTAEGQHKPAVPGDRFRDRVPNRRAVRLATDQPPLRADLRGRTQAGPPVDTAASRPWPRPPGTAR